MNEVRNILVGLDIGPDRSQICYYDRKAKEPVSVPTRVGTNLFAFPTMLVKMSGREEWHYGFEAEYFAARPGGIRVPNPYETALGTETVMIEGAPVEAYLPLAVFIRESLRMLGVPRPAQVVSGIAVTSEKMTPCLAENILRALKHLGFDRRISIVCDHMESFYYYCYSLRPEIWSKSLGLIRFRGDEASFTAMRESRGTKPFAALTSDEGGAALPKEAEARDRDFSAAVEQWTEGSAYSAIFITGSGFSTEWAKLSVRTLSRAASHVFEGDNLFAKGACYALLEQLEKHAFDGRIFLGEEHTRFELGVDVIEGGSQHFLPLIRAGRAYYLCGTECDLILDGRDDLMVTVCAYDGSRHRNVHIPLDGLPERPPRASRLRVSATMESPDTALVRAEDLGFGELYAATHKVWEMRIEQ